MRPLEARIDLARIGHNVEYLKGLIPGGCLFMAVVKANAYGHGDVHVSRAALSAGADTLGVALVEEGVRLREAGFTCPIHVLFEPPPRGAAGVVAGDLTCSVYTAEPARALSAEAVRAGRTAPVHVKVDTGMRRVGLYPGDAPGFARFLAGLPGIEVEGIYTHFAVATEPENEFTAGQMEAFEAAAAATEKILGKRLVKHAANSAGVLAFPGSHYDMVRVGIAMYGLPPSRAFLDRDELRPAMSLVGEVSLVKEVRAGEGISYGLEYEPEVDTNIATLPVGYADGFSRLLTGKAQVLIGGRRRPVVGVICMDTCMVDLGDGRVAAGEPFTLMGRQQGEEINADEIAGRLGTINYEIVCMISSRVPRVYES